MAKKLTLNETWRLCLKMWKWIAEQAQAGNTDVWSLKFEWMRNNWKGEEVHNECFFCEYMMANIKGCNNCPGALIDRKFRCNVNEYHYEMQPIAFYNKLVSLNRKRKKK